MKISCNWLRDYIKTDLTTAEIAEILTQTGLEVEGVHRIEQISGGLVGVVVGEVLTAEQHSNADRLKVTTVNIGGSTPLQIVCGAPNVQVGQKVLVATIGTTLYPLEGEPLKIKKGKIRGEESEGMICAEDEMGIGSSHDGILILNDNTIPGTAASEALSLEGDEVMEIGLTPNRTDGMSHIGVARDLRAALRNMEGIKNDFNAEICWPETPMISSDSSEPIRVSVLNPEACPRYAGVCLSGVKIAPSPDWLQSRLRAIGLHPINNVVDITNYVLHETGQPLHAFDRDKIDGDEVVVKTLKAGTKFSTLDEVERVLDGNDLMICNGASDDDCGMCIAGVFGGIKSGVSEKTTRLFLESACFDPIYIRKTAKRHGLSTDASFRFERGVDPNGTIYALKRAVNLICDIAGGRVVSDITDIYPEPIEAAAITVNLARMNALIGAEIPSSKVKSILTDLDFKLGAEKQDSMVVTPPLYRVDVTREADVVEEVLRIYGYNAVALPEKLNISLQVSLKPDLEKLQNQISDLLVARGYTEIMSNSLTFEAYSSFYETDTIHPAKAVKILNPLSSDLGEMRQSLMFNGLEAIARNINHKKSDLRLFEFGRVYHHVDEKYLESPRLALFISGKKYPENFNNPSDAVAIEEARDSLDSILNRLGLLKAIKSSSDSKPWFTQCEVLSIGRTPIVEFGRLSQNLLTKMDIKQPVFYADIDWKAICGVLGMNRVKFHPLIKYPSVRRDLSLLVDQSVTFDKIRTSINKYGKQLLQDVNLFDVYEGKNLPSGTKSYAVSMVFQDSTTTLSDQTVDTIVDKIIADLKKEVGAELR
jgi:phenylalanyl-tRNA synthetase beta chain